MEQTRITVRQLNMYVKSLIQGDANLSSVYLVGEISNFKNHYGSGHLYFVLKDSEASVKVVMFRANAIKINFVPKDGMMVLLKGYVSLYERDGQYQFYAESMLPFGEGDIAAEFERVKKKLEAEGLFSEARKKKLPKLPKKVGIITSNTGAAINDIINVSNRRFPLAELVIFPALVQGISAPESLISALDKAYGRDDLDVIIIGRGGGSAEDLSCFNDEALAVKISKSSIPIVSAVGHETDFTISDFVADLRAPTPSAAAEIVFPSSDEILAGIEGSFHRIKSNFYSMYSKYCSKLELLKNKMVFKRPEQVFAPFELRVDKAFLNLVNGYKFILQKAEAKLGFLDAKLDAISPQKTFDRGFAVAYKENKVLKDAKDVKICDKILIKLSNGSLNCTVDDILED